MNDSSCGWKAPGTARDYLEAADKYRRQRIHVAISLRKARMRMQCYWRKWNGPTQRIQKLQGWWYIRMYAFSSNHYTHPTRKMSGTQIRACKEWLQCHSLNNINKVVIYLSEVLFIHLNLYYRHCRGVCIDLILASKCFTARQTMKYTFGVGFKDFKQVVHQSDHKTSLHRRCHMESYTWKYSTGFTGTICFMYFIHWRRTHLVRTMDLTRSSMKRYVLATKRLDIVSLTRSRWSY